MDEIKKEHLLKIFDQHWNHQRHVETERFWMLQIYIILSVSFYTLKLADSFLNNIFISDNSPSVNLFIVAIFTLHILFSFLMILATIKLSAEFDRHNLLAVNIAEELGYGEYISRPLQHEENEVEELATNDKKGFLETLVSFLKSNFLSFNRIIVQLYIFFISIDVYIIASSIFSHPWSSNLSIAVMAYWVFFWLSLLLTQVLIGKKENDNKDSVDPE